MNAALEIFVPCAQDLKTELTYKWAELLTYALLQNALDFGNSMRLSGRA